MFEIHVISCFIGGPVLHIASDPEGSLLTLLFFQRGPLLTPRVLLGRPPFDWRHTSPCGPSWIDGIIRNEGFPYRQDIGWWFVNYRHFLDYASWDCCGRLDWCYCPCKIDERTILKRLDCIDVLEIEYRRLAFQFYFTKVNFSWRL